MIKTKTHLQSTSRRDLPGKALPTSIESSTTYIHQDSNTIHYGT